MKSCNSLFFTSLFFVTSLLSSSFAYAGTPVVNNGLASESFAGEQVCFDAQFSNSSATVGYGPYIRLVLPSNITFDSATFLGVAVEATTVGVFPAAPNNQLTDPKIDAPVTSGAGNSLHILTLPLGSVVQNGPALVTNICATISTNAVIGTPLDVSVQGVFEFGDTATGANGAIEGSEVSQSITPTLLNFSSNQNATEGEGVPGSVFPITFTDTIDIANGKTVFDFSHTNSLDSALQYNTGTAVLTGGSGGNIHTEPSTSPGGNVSATITSATGVVGNDITMSYSAYIADVLDESMCAAQAIQTNSTLDIEYPNNSAQPQ